jgi:hypothetical protein
MDQNKLGLLTVIGGLLKHTGVCSLTGFSLAAGGLTCWMLYKTIERRKTAMRKFWKKQVEDLGGDPSVLLKGRTQIAKEKVMALVAAHKEAITVRNAGYVIGRAACVVKNPCVEFYKGVKDGLKN